MQLRLDNRNYNSTPSFGMAKLTAKGMELASDVLGNVVEYCDSNVYQKKNVIKKVINNVAKNADANPNVEFDAFFSNGKTQYAFNNTLFIKKQILPIGAQKKIKSFLKSDSMQAQREQLNTNLTNKGQALVDQLVDVFDANIANENVSAKKGKKILDLVKPYMLSTEISKRLGVVSDKYFAK